MPEVTIESKFNGFKNCFKFPKGLDIWKNTKINSELADDLIASKQDIIFAYYAAADLGATEVDDLVKWAKGQGMTDIENIKEDGFDEVWNLFFKEDGSAEADFCSTRFTPTLPKSGKRGMVNEQMQDWLRSKLDTVNKGRETILKKEEQLKIEIRQQLADKQDARRKGEFSTELRRDRVNDLQRSWQTETTQEFPAREIPQAEYVQTLAKKAGNGQCPFFSYESVMTTSQGSRKNPKNPASWPDLLSAIRCFFACLIMSEFVTAHAVCQWIDKLVKIEQDETRFAHHMALYNMHLAAWSRVMKRVSAKPTNEISSIVLEMVNDDTNWKITDFPTSLFQEDANSSQTVLNTGKGKGKSQKGGKGQQKGKGKAAAQTFVRSEPYPASANQPIKLEVVQPASSSSAKGGTKGGKATTPGINPYTGGPSKSAVKALCDKHNIAQKKWAELKKQGWSDEKIIQHKAEYQRPPLPTSSQP